MPNEQQGEAAGHPSVPAQVLFIDVVDFTTRLPKFQKKIAETLRDILARTKAWTSRNPNDKKKETKFIPTGDGWAIVFKDTDGHQPVELACEVARQLRRHNENQPKKVTKKKNCSFKVRMGIHEGQIFEYDDLSDAAGANADSPTNFAGDAINNAQRVMSFGSGGHLLLTPRAWEHLDEHMPSNTPIIAKNRGPYIAKHGEPFEIIQLVDSSAPLFTKQPPFRRGLLSLLRGRKQCYKKGTRLLKHARTVYSMLCFRGELRGTEKYEQEYRKAVHRVLERDGGVLHRLVNPFVVGIGEYLRKNLNQFATARLHLGITSISALDVLITEGDHEQALITFPGIPSGKRGKPAIDWGVHVEGSDLVHGLRDWYGQFLTEKGTLGDVDTVLKKIQEIRRESREKSRQ